MKDYKGVFADGHEEKNERGLSVEPKGKMSIEYIEIKQNTNIKKTNKEKNEA